MSSENKPAYNRKSTRLQGFDYAQAGAYFITVVTQGRACRFGTLAEGDMRLNAAGVMVAQVCQELPQHIPAMTWGIVQIMPNHFHANVELHNPPVGADLCVCPSCALRAGQPRLKECFAKGCPYG